MLDVDTMYHDASRTADGETFYHNSQSSSQLNCCSTIRSQLSEARSKVLCF